MKYPARSSRSPSGHPKSKGSSLVRLSYFAFLLTPLSVPLASLTPIIFVGDKDLNVFSDLLIINMYFLNALFVCQESGANLFV